MEPAGVLVPILAILVLVAAAALMATLMAASRRRESALRASLAQAERTVHTDAQLLDAAKVMAVEVVASQSGQLSEIAEERYQELHHHTDTLLGSHGRQVAAGLTQLEHRLTALERQRSEDSSSLRQMVTDLRDATHQTRQEAAKLAGALRDNRVRGVWGENQLRSVLESAGMLRYCDFVEQRGVTGPQRSGRPDVVVRLANGRVIVIDAKVPLDRFLDSANCEDPAGARELRVEHARSVAAHVTALSRREYAELVPGAVDMVVMFLPGEAVLTSALDADPGLFETAAAKDVVLASPFVLIPLLRGVAMTWRERQLADEAAEIARLGRDLHDRIGTFAGHFAGVGRDLGKAVAQYNKAVGSMDSRLLATARNLERCGAGSTRAIPAPSDLHLEVATRELCGTVVRGSDHAGGAPLVHR